MTYYRLAVQDHQSTHWIWKTTAVTSLQSILQLLRNYRALPQDSIHVFTASSKEVLGEMLSRQNNHLASGSVTATEFLQARNIISEGQAHCASAQCISAQTVQQTADAVPWATRPETDAATWTWEIWEKHRAAQAARQGAGDVPTSRQREHLATADTLLHPGMSFQDKKRLEIELGPGGNHDSPYYFTMPISLQERLTWLRLQKQVQAGELPS